MKKTSITAGLLLATLPAMAKDDSLLSGEMKNYAGYGLIVLTMILFVVALLVLLRAFTVMAKVVLKLQGYTNAEIDEELKPARKTKEVKQDVWLKALSLRPMSEEKEILIEHDYDGIQELNNPTPAWFMWLFYGTIAFGVSYILIYHVFGFGQLQYEEYKTEMAQADIAKKEYLSKAANQVDENTVKLTTDAGVLSAGQAIFKQTCSPCHGEHAQGVVGPNLTDDYWLHGNKINDLFKTIKYGVAAKGMPTWEKQLSPKQISDVANYVKSLHGSNPANPKAPQGDKITEDSNKIAAK